MPVYDDQDTQHATDQKFNEIVQAERLREAENKSGTKTNEPDVEGGLKELEDHANKGLFNQQEDADDDENRRRFMPKTSRKKLWLAGGGVLGGLIILFAVAIMLFSLLGNFKNIHFATLLRTVGMARFTYVMHKQYARVIFDAAVLTDSSTGSAAKALKRNNVPRQLTQLGTDGTLKFDFEKGSSFGGLKTTNQFKGVVIKDKVYSLDAVSQALHGDKFNDLSRRQKRAVRVEFAEQVKFGMNNALRTEGRMYRISALDNMRKVAGIRMIKWTDKARMYLGKSPKDARKLNYDDLKQNVDRQDRLPKSGLKAIQDEADKAQKDTDRAVLNGETPGQTRTRWGNTVRTTAKISAAVFATTMACIVGDIDNSFEQTKKETEMRAMRLGHDALTGGSQAVDGDVYAEATNAESTRWDNAEKSVLYKQSTGQTKLSKNDQQQLMDIPHINGPSETFASVIDTIDNVIFPETIAGNAIDSLLNAVGIEKSLKDVGCDALLNEYVQYAIAGTELTISIGSAGATGGVIAGLKAAVSGALVAAGSIGLGQLLGTLIDKAVASYSGRDYGASLAGEPLYNQSQVGVNRFAQTADQKVNYGRPLNDDEARQAQTVAMDSVKKQISEKSLSYRYFAIDNPFSLTGKLVAHTPSDLTGFGSSLRESVGSVASIFSTPQQFLSSLGSVFMPTQYAMAEQGQNMLKAGGVDVWGVTDKELERLDTEDQFELDANDKYFDDNEEDLREKYDKCYIGFDSQTDKPKECTGDYLGTDAALHYRLHESTMILAGHMEGGVK